MSPLRGFASNRVPPFSFSGLEMSLFTSADRDAVKAAYLQALVDGIASATIGGQQITGWTVEQWKKALDQIQQDLATDQPRHGMRMVKTVPPGCG